MRVGKVIGAAVGVAALGLLALTAGCDGSDGGSVASSTSSGPTLAADVPTGFDPCTDIPQSLLDAEELYSTNSSTSREDVRRGDIRWVGCGWVMTDGYAVGITTTNLTLDMIRAKGKPGLLETTVAGRAAVYGPDQPGNTEQCRLNAQLQGGSMEISLSNPSSNRKTGGTDSCELAVRLAEKVGVSIPAGV